jgi:hypothetical protein
MTEEILANIKISGSSEQLNVRHISENLYRIEETSLLNSDLLLGAIAVLKINENGDYELIKIVEKSKYIIYNWILTKHFIASDKFEELKTTIRNFSGTWEQIMHGVFIAHIPETNNQKFISELELFKLLTKK